MRGSKMKTKKLTEKQEKEQLKKKVDDAMIDCNFRSWFLIGYTGNGRFRISNTTYAELLQIRAELDKVILENTE